MTRGILLAAALALTPSPARCQPAEAPVATVANVSFYSNEWLNLHHVLYAAAWARRPQATPSRSLSEPLPAPLEAAMTPEERTAWDLAIEFYDKNLASRDLLFGRDMIAINTALHHGNLAGEAITKDHRAALESVLPIYRRYFWPSHDRANRQWVNAAADRMKTVAPEVIARLEKLYGVQWFTTPVRADVVWVGNRQGAYTSTGPAHATISTAGPAGWSSVEIVFHEYSHILVLPLQEALEAALGDRVRQHRDLWHVIQFYLTGAAVQQVLAARDIVYTTYLDSGLFDRAWPQYHQVIDQNWKPYVRGAITRDAAISGTVQTLR